MPVLNCNVTTCYYNKENHCCLEHIRVDGPEAVNAKGTECASFRELAFETSRNECSCTSAPETRLSVSCEATKCTFNRNHVCSAEHIGIAGNGAKHAAGTCCASFEAE